MSDELQQRLSRAKKLKQKNKRNICMALLLINFVGSAISQRKHLEMDCLCMLFNIYLNLDFEKDWLFDFYGISNPFCSVMIKYLVGLIV